MTVKKDPGSPGAPNEPKRRLRAVGGLGKPAEPSEPEPNGAAHYRTVGDALRAEQARRGLSQVDAATIIGVSRGVYNKWVSVDRPVLPSYDNVPSIGRFLHLRESEVIRLFPESYRARVQRSAAARHEVDELREQVAALTDVVGDIAERLAALAVRVQAGH